MKVLLAFEQLAIFVFSIYLFTLLPYEWHWFLILLLAPDAGMVGYLVNPKIGSITYNLTHHQGIALLAYLFGVIATSNILMLIGVIMLAHSSLDRVLGYGLKYPDKFKHTHLDT